LLSAASGVRCAGSRHTARTTTTCSSRVVTHCPRCGHTAHRDQQAAISIHWHNAVLEYVTTGERQASKVKAGRH